MVPGGRAMLGAQWHIAEQKSAKLFVANPQELQMAQWFCGAVSSMLSSMAFAGPFLAATTRLPSTVTSS
jgi:hypothetical protein